MKWWFYYQIQWAVLISLFQHVSPGGHLHFPGVGESPDLTQVRTWLVFASHRRKNKGKPGTRKHFTPASGALPHPEPWSGSLKNLWPLGLWPAERERGSPRNPDTGLCSSTTAFPNLKRGGSETLLAAQAGRKPDPEKRFRLHQRPSTTGPGIQAVISRRQSPRTTPRPCGAWPQSKKAHTAL